jgi:NAD(P)-dependent dehydrogenase (short-subunit alcohol dehydrogenase family)
VQPDAIAVVTGGSLGIGAAITRALLGRGYTVIVGCRSPERARGLGAGRLEVEKLDVSDVGSVRAFAARIAARHSRIDVLVNNAGASFQELRRNAAGLELTFATNVQGDYAVTDALRPLLRNADGRGRVVHVGSAAQYLLPLQTSALLSATGPYIHGAIYAHTKRAQYELSEAMAERLDADGITSTCAHPGLVATPGVAEAFPTWSRVAGRVLPSPEEGADTAVWLATAPEIAGSTGGFWWRRTRQPADVVPWTRARRGERSRLWDACQHLCR